VPSGWLLPARSCPLTSYPHAFRFRLAEHAATCHTLPSAACVKSARRDLSRRILYDAMQVPLGRAELVRSCKSGCMLVIVVRRVLGRKALLDFHMFTLSMAIACLKWHTCASSHTQIGDFGTGSWGRTLYVRVRVAPPHRVIAAFWDVDESVESGALLEAIGWVVWFVPP